MTYVKDFFGPNVLINESEKIEIKNIVPEASPAH